MYTPSFLSLKKHFTQIISGSTRLIFTRFSLYGRYLIVDYRFDLCFLIAQGKLPWQPVLWLKWAKSADLPSLVALAFLKRVEYRNSDSKRFVCDDLATLRKNLVNFGPVTPEFKIGKDVTP